MKSIALKLDNTIFEETDEITMELNMSRNRYINEAVAFYNRVQRRLLLEEKLKKESELVRDESLRVLQEFEESDEID
jgi:hypothetical protein